MILGLKNLNTLMPLNENIHDMGYIINLQSCSLKQFRSIFGECP